MNTKRFCILALMAGMAVPMMALAAGISDISASPNQTAIQYLYDNNIITGYSDGTFKPDNTVNRAELLKILVGGKGITPSVAQYHNCFPDVTNEWFAPYVCYAKAQGWVQGYSDNTFRPAQVVNKVEAVKMLVNSQGYTIPASANETLFNDVQNTQWYAPYLQAAKDKGLLGNSSGNYGVTDGMTRGEISENIYRAIIVKNYALEKFTSDFNNSTTESTSAQSTNSNQTSTNLSAGTSPLVISGTGNSASKQFSLKKGLAIFTLTYSGKENFIVNLLDSDGNSAGYLTNAIGDYSGSQALAIQADGSYLFNVEASGPWSITISQTIPSSAAATFPLVIAGTGNSVSKTFTLQQGLAVFDMQYSGTENFIVNLLDKDGNSVGYLANEIGNYKGSQALAIPTTGTYIFNVESSGPWSVTITQPKSSAAQSTTDFSGKGATATPIFSLASGLHTFTMTHDGQSNFIVTLLDNKGAAVNFLANEIGEYNGSQASHIDADGLYLLNVQADGNWTVKID